MDVRFNFRPKHLLFLLLVTFTLINPLSVEPAGKAAGPGDFVRVKIKWANTRSGPGKRYEKLWRAPLHYPYQVVRRKGRWLKVKDYTDYAEWIYAPLTDRKPTVVVKVKMANVRRGPGRNHPIEFTAEEGIPFRVLKRRKSWLKVRHEDNDTGWIFARLVWGKVR